MNDEIEMIIPPKIPSKLAKQLYKETDGLKRILSKTNGVNEELLGSFKSESSSSMPQPQTSNDELPPSSQ